MPLKTTSHSSSHVDVAAPGRHRTAWASRIPRCTGTCIAGAPPAVGAAPRSAPSGSVCASGAKARDLTAQLVLGDHPIHEAVVACLLSGEKAVALHVVAHPVLALAGMSG